MAQLSIFVSHNHADTAFAAKLVDALRSNGADVWYDEHNLGLGQIRIEIDRELRARRVFIVTLSKAAVASDWVQEETANFYELYKLDPSRIILPVIIEPLDYLRDNVPTYLLRFVRIEKSAGVPFPQDAAIERTAQELGLQLRGEELYPTHVSEALRVRYRGLGTVTSPLGKPLELTAADAREQRSRRGTTGYVRPFSHGILCWTERGGAQPIWRGIQERFNALGGISGFLGFPMSGEQKAGDQQQPDAGSVYQRFEFVSDYPKDVLDRLGGVRCGATVYWSRRHGPYATWGGIGACFERLGGTIGFLGFPTSAELDAGPSQRGTKGKVQHFEGGDIYWNERIRHQAGVQIHGAIRGLYLREGGPKSRFGFPLTPEIPAAPSPFGTTGVVQRFEGMRDYADDIEHDPKIAYGASLYWSLAHGEHPTWGSIGACFERLHGTASFLGFPMSTELKAERSPQGTAGVYQRFEGGHIYYSSKYGAVPVSGATLKLYLDQAGSGGRYGFPISAEQATSSGGTVQQFEGGMIGTMAQGPDAAAP